MGEWVGHYRYQLAVAALATGLAIAPAGWAVAAAGAAVAGGLLGLASRAGVAGGCVLLLVGGAAVGELRLRAIDAPGSRLDSFAQVDGRALLLERPRSAGPRTSAAIRLASGEARGAKLLATTDGAWRGPAEPGVELRVRGLAKPPLRAERSRFDWPAHLRRRGIAYELQLSDVAATGARRGGIPGAVDSLRRRAEGAIDRSLPPDKAALMRGMVLGQDEAIDPLTRDDWRDSGLAHLLAVSGQNVMLLCALALPFLALAGASPRVRILVLLALIAVYVPLAGAGPSLQRAAVMGAAGLAALASARPASAAYGLLLAAAATLAVNPRIAGDPGWQLSFAAVIGILAARPLAPRSPLGAAAWLTASASVATTPLLALHFGAVPLVSIPANLAALPAVAPVMWIGMLQTTLGQVNVLGGPGSALAGACSRGLGIIAEPLLAWLQLVANRAAAMPHAVAEVELSGVAPVVASYAVLVALGAAAFRAKRQLQVPIEELRARVRLVPRRSLAAALLAGACVVLVVGGRSGGAPGAVTVSFLDVGQGDATLVRHPDGSAVLFDGGLAEARVTRLLRQEGVARLSMVVSTHKSADHHGGLVEVVQSVPVETLVENGQGTRDPTYAELLEEARARGVEIVTARAGQLFRAGGLTVRVLWPPPRAPGPAPVDPNPSAVVALVSSGSFDLFLSADAESPTLIPLELPDVEAMKVPHHGSDDPGLAGLLGRLRPEVAVIEVGEENTYGHPTPGTVSTLERLVPEVRRTDVHGTVRLEVAPGGLRLEP